MDFDSGENLSGQKKRAQREKLLCFHFLGGFERRSLQSPRNFAGMSRALGRAQKVCAK